MVPPQKRIYPVCPNSGKLDWCFSTKTRRQPALKNNLCEFHKKLGIPICSGLQNKFDGGNLEQFPPIFWHFKSVDIVSVTRKIGCNFCVYSLGYPQVTDGFRGGKIVENRNFSTVSTGLSTTFIHRGYAKAVFISVYIIEKAIFLLTFHFFAIREKHNNRFLTAKKRT